MFTRTRPHPRWIAAFWFLAALSPLHADPTVTLAPGAAAQTLDLHLTDTTNSTWTLQTSSDLNTWQDRTTFRVRNSLHTFNVDNTAGGPATFFRFLSGTANLSNSVADATTLPAIPDNYGVLALPAHLLTPVIVAQNNTPADNPVTDAGATLGRVLFYDKRLSANNTISCASCHQAAHGCSDPTRVSTGFAGGQTGRNSMGLTSARYYPRRSFFWDERAATLEDQVLMPIQNEVEMGLTLDQLVAKVSAETY